MFKQNKLSLAIVAVLASVAAANQAVAQEDTATVEEVVVTGIRASIQASMDVKRDATGVVDAISAEDIGKMPDSNLAESLQRIPGVSIDRSNGEGSKVTVRGFGADKNLITLNGRQLPTTTGDRTFDFANVASEAVSAVEVYKTSDATVTSGGIGATINLKTHRPLSSPGLKATVGAKLVMDDSAVVGGTTPEISGLYSQTFADDKFGVSLSASYQERESGLREFLHSGGYRSSSPTNTGWGGAPEAPAGGANRPALDADGIISVPQQPRYVFEDRQRERINGQLVLQFDATDDIRLTADYLMVSNTYETQHTDVSAWFSYKGDRTQSVWSDGPNAYPTLYTEQYSGNEDTSLTVGAYGQEEKVNSLGFNIEWQATERLALELDIHSSEGSREATDPRRGTVNNLQLPSYTRTKTALDLTGGLPGIGIGPNDLESFNPDTLQLSGGWFQNHRYTSETQQVQLKGNYVIAEDSMSIDFGLSTDTVNNNFQFVNVERPDWGGVGDPGDFSVAQGIDWREDTVLDKFSDSIGDFTGEAVDYVALDRIWYADFDQIVAAAELADPEFGTTSNIHGDCLASDGGAGSAPIAGVDDGGFGQFCASSNFGLGRSEFTEEETTVAYVQFNLEGELGDMPYDFHAGLRSESTDVHSTSSAAAYSSVSWNEETQAALDGTGQFVTFEDNGSYSVMLPSINFNLSPRDDVKVRAAIGETISRPGYTDLLGGTRVGGNGTRGGYSASRGNTGLTPLESFNIDLSVEWYYSDASYASVGTFSKKVSNWTSTDVESSAVYDQPLYNPLDGAKFNEAVAALGSDAGNDAIRAWIFDNYDATDPLVTRSTEAGADPDAGSIQADPATDEIIMFDVRFPVNSPEERTVEGFEFNVQHMFGETGFGAIVNYTLVDSDIAYDDLELSDTPALVGLSNSANVIAFYENYGVQARIAYNWRDEFLSERRVDGDRTAGVYTEGYSQIDLNVSYNLPMLEELTVYFEGINITDQSVKQHGRNEALVHRLTETGARYNLGVRYTF